MSHLYGTVQGNRGEATRGGSKGSGIETYAASWRGAIRVKVYYDEAAKEDRFVVEQVAWHGAGVTETLASGTLGKRIFPKGVTQDGRVFAALNLAEVKT